MDLLVYVSVAVIIIILLLLVNLLTRSHSQETPLQNENDEARPVARGPAPRNAEPLAAGARRRPVRRRMRTTALADDDSESEGEEGDVYDDIAQPEGKVGAKKLRKLQEKAERKTMREQEERDRAERKQHEAELEELRKKEALKKDAEEAEREEEERKRKEEEEKQAYEEYLKLKEMFTVEEEGEQGEDPDLESQSLLQEFIDYVKSMKVVMLEDLANHFKIKTQDAINRVQELIAEGRLTGVMDDRGKFIYITMEELESVAKFIRQHGRVSISELAESSNRLINLAPDNAETVKKLYTEVA